LFDQAIAASLKATELSNHDATRLAGLGRAYALAGRRAEAAKVLGQLRHPAGSSYVSPYYSATIYAALGQDDAAFASLQEALQEHDGYLVWLKADTALDPLRPNHRFRELLRKVGLA
jgi:hypothetical protein